MNIQPTPEKPETRSKKCRDFEDNTGFLPGKKTKCSTVNENIR